ncbi:MAG: hypothetical protein ACOCP4_07270 [Candidatus Woesearchaeota archaeon]
MKKYLNLLKFEFKNILRDKMTLILLIYPFLIMLLGAYLIPAILERTNASGSGEEVAILIIIIVFAVLAPFITSALLGFTLLDNRDENTLVTIRVTPISLKGYIMFKSIYAYILSVNATFWVIYGTKLLSGDSYTVMGKNLFDAFTISNTLFYSVIVSLFTPVFGLFVSAFARNKVEGFAYLKGSGLFIMIPVLSVLNAMQDARQYILGIIPLFWPVKGLMVDANLLTNDANLPVLLYMIIGALYMILLICLSYKVFENKVSS